MNDKFVFIPNDFQQNYTNKIVETNSLETTNQNSIKVPKVFEPTKYIRGL